MLACFFVQLPSTCRNSGAREFRRNFIGFGVLFAAITFGVSKYWCSNFDENSSILACFFTYGVSKCWCSNFDEKSSISAWFLVQLHSVCRNVNARISTKNHRFWRAFCRNYHRRVEFIDAQIWTKLHRFWRAFCRNYHRRVDFFVTEFRRKIIDFGVLFHALSSAYRFLGARVSTRASYAPLRPLV